VEESPFFQPHATIRWYRDGGPRVTPVGSSRSEQVGHAHGRTRDVPGRPLLKLCSEGRVLPDLHRPGPVGFPLESFGHGSPGALRRDIGGAATGRSRYTSAPAPDGVSDAARRPLVIGSGIAGLYVALRCRELGLRPTIVTKSRLEESNTRYAQGGIAAAIGPGDSPALHLKDTIRAGDGLVDRDAARVLTSDAPARIADLVRYGVPFDTVEGQIALGREAAHSHARILHAGGDATGLSIEEALKHRALDAGIDVRERTVLRRLEPGDRDGPKASLTDADGHRLEILEPRPVVLATGGAGSLYRQSSNPSIATGEGVAIAFRAGALLTDMEFIQFHPTVFWRDGAPRFLITEAFRGEGAVLRNAAGERFMPALHRDAEMAPRDVVARAIDREIQRTNHPCVYLDATAVPRDRLFVRFPTICRFLAAYGLDPSRDPIPVTPAAHYMIGGVTTDLDGRSTLRGLYACGEVASTGVHGANRLASNSLLEGLVFGERVARQLLHPVARAPPPPSQVVEVPVPVGAGRGDEPEMLEEVRDLLWNDVGIVRTADGLRSALAALERIARATEPGRSSDLPGPLANAQLTASLIARAALARNESRGAHYRSDYPRRRPEWRHHIGLQRPARPERARPGER
jgi:L-aspartate oxidase